MIARIIILFAFTATAALFFGAEKIGLAQGQEEQAGQLYTGEINSLINTGGATWIAKGNWDLVLEDEDVNDFTVDMVWFTSDGVKSHTHYLKDFDMDNLLFTPTGSIVMTGDLDVGTEGKISWDDVPANITIGSGKTLNVNLDDAATDSHFGAQTLFGIVDAVQECGNTPGPGMSLRAPCELPDTAIPGSASVIQGPSGQLIIAGPG